MPRMVFLKLHDWQRRNGVKDVALAEKAGMAHTTLGRAKRGKIVLGVEKMIALQTATEGEITPNDWAEFYKARNERAAAEAGAHGEVHA